MGRRTAPGSDELGALTRSVAREQPETFDFLGFTHIAGKSREGKFQLKRRTSRKKRRAKLARLKEELERRRHDPVAGVCGCPDGMDLCDGVCVALATDLAHCGECTTSCSGTEVCSQGDCVADCANGETECAGACVITDTDTNNCGGCGIACTGGRACELGVCTCPENTEECGDPPVCANTESSVANCGGCGIQCDSGEICVDGDCAGPGGFESCMPVGGGDAVCTNVKIDELNCGDCGVPCAGNGMNGECQL